MTAKNVSVGLTYMVKVSEKEVPVTLTRTCPYGGWYGKNTVTGHSVRIKTAQRLREQVNQDGTQLHPNVTTVQEDTNMAPKPAARVTAADRRARRSANNGNGSTATVEMSASEKLDAAMAEAKTTVKEVNAAAKKSAKPKPAAKAKPAAKQAAKSTPTESDNTVKENNTVPTNTKPATRTRRRAAAKSAPVAAPVAAATLTVEEMIAEAAAKLVAEMIAKGEVTTTVQPVAERKLAPVAAKSAAKPVAKSVKVTLKASGEKRHSWYFKFMGKAVNPAVTGCYVSKTAIEQFEAGAKSLTAKFDRAEGKKHSILFREAEGDNTIFNGSLYVMRNALNGSGITEDTPVDVTITVKSDTEITLTIVAA